MIDIMFLLFTSLWYVCMIYLIIATYRMATRTSDKVIQVINYCVSAAIISTPIYYYLNDKLPKAKNSFRNGLTRVIINGERWGNDVDWENFPLYAKAQDIRMKQMVLYLQEKSEDCKKKVSGCCVMSRCDVH